MFSNQPTPGHPALPRTEDPAPGLLPLHAARCRGARRGFGRACSTSTRLCSGSTASDGDLILPKLGQSNRGRVASRCWQKGSRSPRDSSLQPAPQGCAGAAGACPACMRFLLQMPFGKEKNVGSSSIRRQHEEGKLLLCTCTLAHAGAVALRQHWGTAWPKARRKPQSLATSSSGAEARWVPAGMAFSSLPACPVFGKDQPIFVLGWGDVPKAVAGV